MLFIVLCSIGTINAQKTQSTPIEQLLTRLEQTKNNSGDINAFFSKSEQLQLRSYFANKRKAQGASDKMDTKSTSSKSTNSIGTVYCAINGTAEFGSFDITDGSTITVIGPSSVVSNFENAGSIDPNNITTAYVIDNTGDAFTVDVATGTYTALGNIAGAWTCGEFDPISGTFYAMDGNGDLYTIDFVDLTATLVGNTGVSGGVPIGLAIDGSGAAYYYDVVDDNLYSIDLTTGVGTVIGSIGFDANYGQGMFWDKATNTVYMTAFNAGAVFDSEFRSVDLATGATTLINQMDAGTLTQYAWASTEAIDPPFDCGGAVSENFDAGLPAGWSTVINTGTCDWQNGSDVPTGDFFATPAMFFNDDACGNGAPASNVSLLSDVYNTVGATFITLTYNVGFQSVGNNDSFTVEVYDGTAWVQVAQYLDDLVPNIQMEVLDVTAYANADFQVRWTYDDDGGSWGWYGAVDNFCLDHDATASTVENTIIGFEFYPNPSNDVINIKALNNIDYVEVFNMMGQKIINQSFNTNEGTLNVSKLNTGVYVMKVTANGEVASYQFIKK